MSNREVKRNDDDENRREGRRRRRNDHIEDFVINVNCDTMMIKKKKGKTCKVQENCHGIHTLADTSRLDLSMYLFFNMLT